MLKKILIVFLCFTSFSLYAQMLQKAFEVKWKPLTFTGQADNRQVPVLSFENAVYNDPSGLLPFFSFEIDLDEDVSDIVVSMDNERYIKKSIPGLEELSRVFKPVTDKINIHTRIKKTAKGKTAQITFIPIISDQNTRFLQLLTAFNLNIKRLINQEKQASTAIEFSSESAMANGAWYKFKVEKSGVHRITGADLQKAGIALSSLNPTKISVFGFGGMLPEKIRISGMQIFLNFP